MVYIKGYIYIDDVIVYSYWVIDFSGFWFYFFIFGYIKKEKGIRCILLEYVDG